MVRRLLSEERPLPRILPVSWLPKATPVPYHQYQYQDSCVTFNEEDADMDDVALLLDVSRDLTEEEFASLFDEDNNPGTTHVEKLLLFVILLSVLLHCPCFFFLCRKGLSQGKKSQLRCIYQKECHRG